MKIYHIAAMSENNVIGNNNKLPWVIKRDMKRFKEVTKGHAILMGRKTWSSLPQDALPHRSNIVVSRMDQIKTDKYGILKSGGRVQMSPSNTSLSLFSNIEEGISEAERQGYEELYVIGGGEIYKQTLTHADALRLTLVHKEYEGDAFYPELDESEWLTAWVEPGENYSFIDLVRKPSSLEEL